MKAGWITCAQAILLAALCVTACGDSAAPTDSLSAETSQALSHPSFDSPKGFLTGRGNPNGVAAGDFNNDGHLDIATVVQTDDAGTVWFGHGDGTFTQGPDFAAGAPLSALSADWNHDGKGDLAIVSNTQSDVTILLGDGDGTFDKPTRYAVGKTPLAIASGDFNGDGRVDLATGNVDGASISILLGNADGTFKESVDYDSGNQTGSLAVADLNGDGKLDVVIPQTTRIAILLGKGDGTFDPVTTQRFGGLDGMYIAAGDLNGDGKPDLAVASYFRNYYGLNILLNQGGGIFAEPVPYPASGAGSQVLVADMNGDGKPDVTVLTADENHGILDVYLGKGDGALTPKLGAVKDLDIASSAMANADFDKDGTVDLAVVDPELEVVLGKGNGTFQPTIRYGSVAGHNPDAIAARDVDGDGKMDLLTANLDTNDISLLRGDGYGGFASAVHFATGAGPNGIAVGDFNNDRRSDVVTVNGGLGTGNDVTVLLGNGQGSFGAPLHSAAKTYGGASGTLATADFNRDGKLDIAITVLTTDNTSSPAVLLGDGEGHFQAARVQDIGLSNALGVAAGDVNGDGKPDLVAGAGQLQVFLGNGNGTFVALSGVYFGCSLDLITLGDVNGDGKLDIVGSCSSEGKLAVLPGKGDGTFGAGTLHTVASAGNSVLADFNRDGRLDIATANPFGFGPTGIDVLTANPGGGFGAARHLNLIDNGVAAGFVAADLNSDGKPDLAAAETPNQKNLVAILLDQ